MIAQHAAAVSLHLRQPCSPQELMDDLKTRRAAREGVPHATLWIPPAKKDQVDSHRLNKRIHEELQLIGEIYETNDLVFVGNPSPDVKLISLPRGDRLLKANLASLTEILLRTRFPIIIYTEEDPRTLTKKASPILRASFFRCAPLYAVLFGTDTD